jgi:hypothetical protein
VSPTSATVVQGGSASYTVGINRTGGFSSAVSLSASGLPAGVTATFTPNPASGASSALGVATASDTPPGTYPFTITGTGGALTRTTSATLVVQATPVADFAISVSPASVTLPQGGSGSTTTTVTSVNGFNSATTLSVSGLPSGVTGTFSVNPVTPPAGGSASSTLNLTATAAAATGTFTATVTGTSGALSHSTSLTVTVTTAGQVTVFQDGAESATTTLTFTRTTSSTRWTRQASAPFAGSWRWKAGNASSGNYGNNGDARMTTPTLDLSGAATASLSYAFKYHTETSFDFFEVRISTDGGSTWTNLVRVSGASANWSLWAPLNTIDLHNYAGQTNVKIQFRLTTDPSVTDFGVGIDEIKVTKQ